MSTPNMQSAVTPQRIMQLAWGFAPSLIIAAAVQIRIFDELDQRPKTVEEMSAATGASERGLRGLMNALVGFELASKDESGRYRLSADSATFLVSGKPSSLTGFVGHIDRDLIQRWTGLPEIVRTGRPAMRANQQQEGSAFFKDFVEVLFPMGYPSARVLAENLALGKRPGEARVLDLAAGSGVWGIAIAQNSPNVRLTAVDWPEVLPVTREVAGRFGLSERLDTIAGDLLEVDFGTGFQAATLGHILHSEGEERSRKLVRKVFQALAPGGTIAIAEFLVNEERTGPPMGLIFGVNMLVATEQGDTFSFGEISGWLREAGFENARTLEAPGPSPLILADRPA